MGQGKTRTELPLKGTITSRCPWPTVVTRETANPLPGVEGLKELEHWPVFPDTPSLHVIPALYLLALGGLSCHPHCSLSSGKTEILSVCCTINAEG